MDRIARLKSGPFLGLERSGSYLSGRGSQILSHILVMRSRSNIERGRGQFRVHIGRCEGILNDPMIRETDDGCIPVAVI
jgi:hypothetical protein